MNTIEIGNYILKQKLGTALYNENLSEYTSFRIGGPADLIICPKDNASIIEIVNYFNNNNIDYHIMGNGSNLLYSDDGIRKPILMLRNGTSLPRLIDEAKIEINANLKLVQVCEFALEHNLTGMEFAYGIPGCVGGALTMNAGAYGGEMSDIVESVSVITKSGEIKVISNKDMDFGYRHSILKDGMIALSCEIRLNPGNYDDIKSRMMELLNARKDKQPLNYPSAGSVFKRPEGYFAGALIQESGLKGFSIGGAQVSEKHAGFIVNKGGATCNDVLELIAYIQDKVKKDHGVELETELRPIFD